jgi:DNA-directed RNA polymerase subunit RPC12/RpoP
VKIWEFKKIKLTEKKYYVILKVGDYMYNNKLQDIRCTSCGNLVCKKYTWADAKGILFWCRKCKKNFELNKSSAPVADE